MRRDPRDWDGAIIIMCMFAIAFLFAVGSIR